MGKCSGIKTHRRESKEVKLGRGLSQTDSVSEKVTDNAIGSLELT